MSPLQGQSSGLGPEGTITGAGFMSFEGQCVCPLLPCGDSVGPLLDTTGIILDADRPSTCCLLTHQMPPWPCPVAVMPRASLETALSPLWCKLRARSWRKHHCDMNTWQKPINIISYDTGDMQLSLTPMGAPPRSPAKHIWKASGWAPGRGAKMPCWVAEVSIRLSF